MSANNIVIIEKIANNKFIAYHRDYDAHIEGQYDNDDDEKAIFTASSAEDAIQAYNKWIDEMNDDDSCFPFIVEYGYEFEGV